MRKIFFHLNEETLAKFHEKILFRYLQTPNIDWNKWLIVSSHKSSEPILKLALENGANNFDDGLEISHRIVMNSYDYRNGLSSSGLLSLNFYKHLYFTKVKEYNWTYDRFLADTYNNRDFFFLDTKINHHTYNPLQLIYQLTTFLYSYIL